ncbi:hypothetical protein BSKO_03921 [Bryopsis sp. KO-2023]|nr:hypothetical protein BSKO_03921 [Bryopsis sp. KO-2023]
MGRKKRSAPPTEDFAFPRGGGSELSQKDVEKLEEQIDERFDEGAERSKRPKKKIRKERKERHTALEEVVVAETMAKRLSKKMASIGMKFWGMVVDIGPSHLKISLPNGLEGRVHASEASDVHAEAYQTLDAEADEHHRGHRYPSNLPPLAALFFVGQFVRCTVTADWEPIEDSVNLEPRMPVALSLVVSKLHEGLLSKSLREGMLIGGCIRSVEDHGYTVALGLGGKNSGVTGFLPRPSSESGPALSLSPGMVMEFCIRKLLPNGSVMLSCDAEEIAGIVRDAGPKCDFGEIIPGMMVNATIESMLPSGLGFSFLEHSGHVGLNHLIEDIPSEDWQSNYAVQQTLPARVIHVNPSTQDVGLSLKPHLLQFAMPMMPPIVGQTFENARVLRSEPGVGLLVEIPSETMRSPGFVDSHMLDEKIAKLEPKKLIGKKLTVRVTGFRPMEGLLMACAKKEILKSGIFGFEDLLPGMLVKALVVEAKEGDSLIVKLAEGIRGLVPGCHRGALKKDQSVKIGMEVDCRILNVRVNERKVWLTTNPRMIKSDLPIIADVNDLEVGKRSLGWSKGKYFPKGMLVQFFGNQAGYIPYDELGVKSEEEATSQYPMGETIKVYISRVDPRKGKVDLSLSKPSMENGLGGIQPRDLPRSEIELEPCEGGQLWPGDIVKGRIKKILENSHDASTYIVSVSSKERGVKGEAILKQPHLSDSRMGCMALSKAVQEGTALGHLMVLEVGPQLIVTRKSSLISKADALPSEFDDIQESMLVQGYVSKIRNSFICIKFLGGLEGDVKNHQFPMPDIPPHDQFYIGQSARAQVLKTSPPQQTFTLTMNKHRTGSTDTAFLQDAFADVHFAQKILAKQDLEKSIWKSWPKELAIGRSVMILIGERGPDGWKCCCKEHKEIDGFLDHTHAPAETELTTGTEIKAIILDVSPERFLSFSAKAELLTKRNKESKRVSAVGSKLRGVVQAANNTYAILSIPTMQQELAFVPTSDYNVQSSGGVLSVGQVVEGLLSVSACKGTGGRTLLYVPLFQQQVRKKPEPVGGVTSTSGTNIDDAKTRAKTLSDRRSKLDAVGEVEQGSVLSGKVTDSRASGVEVLLENGLVGFVPYCDVFDRLVDDIPAVLERGTKVSGKVVGMKAHAGLVILSLRESEGGAVDQEQIEFKGDFPQRTNPELLKNLPSIHGYITKLGFDGKYFYVSLGRGVEGKLPSKCVGKDRLAALGPGKLVDCKIWSITSSGQVNLMERGSWACESLKEGVSVQAKVTRVQGQHFFAEILGIGLLGRAFCGARPPDQHQPVAVRIDSMRNGKVALKDLGSSEPDIKNYPGGRDSGEMEVVNGGVREERPESMAGDVEAEMDVDGEDGLVPVAESDKEVVRNMVDDEEMVESDSELEEITSDEEAEDGQPVSDAWGGLELEKEGAKQQSVSLKAKKRKSGEVADEGVEAKRKRLEEEREDRIRQEEKRQISDDQTPSTSSDFEKLVLEAPDSSYVWIQYITFLLSLEEVAKARAVAERALETINFREEQEKFNVWVAFLNLENMYAKAPEDAVSTLFQRALPYNNPKKLHMALIDILDGSGKTEMCTASLKTTCRKFSMSAKVWLRAIEFDMRIGQGGLAKKTLGRALKSLPTRKHIKVISKTGLMEFKSGNIERGREVFEGLVTNYPKKLDLWNLYIDQEIRAGDVDRTKSLFERATHLALPPRKIKFLFKRYLQYVKDRGDVDGVDHVKRRAVEYVERNAK